MPNENDEPMTGGAALVSQELKNKVQSQEYKYRQTIPYLANLDVEGTPGAQVLDKIRMSSEGDFLCVAVTAKLIGLDPITGLPVDPITFGGTGLTLRLTESGFGRELFRDYAAVEGFATPGYGPILYQPFPFEQVLLSQSDITFDIRNSSPVKQVLKWEFHGWQFRGSYKVRGR